MATFWTWALRNPFFLAAGLMLAAGVTGVLDWGLALTSFSAAALVAHTANHLAHKSRERGEIKAAIDAAQIRRLERKPSAKRYLDYVDESEAPYEAAA